MLQDKFNRVHNYLRISLTDNCNLRCFYCMPDEHITTLPSSRLMSAEEIDRLAAIFVGLGVNKIRLTGGEPLVRKDAGQILQLLAAHNTELTLTTNGTRLHHFINDIKKASIRSINISLDTLDPDKFFLITKRNDFNTVWNNIQLMLNSGIHVKLNVVVMKNINDNELLNFIEWTRHVAVHIRFIEFMPFTGNGWSSNKVFTWQEILETVEKKYSFIPLQRNQHDTAKKYQVYGHRGTFAVISTMTSPFCGDCNRIRLTADGKMKNCLFSKTEVDLLQALRKGEDVEHLIHECISSKAAELGGQFTSFPETIDPLQIENRSMIAIGG